jgi:hypothetical protein
MARSEWEDDEFDLDSIGVDGTPQYFADVGALPSTAPSGSGVLSQQPPDPAAQVSILSFEELLQRLLAQPSRGLQPAAPPQAPLAPTSVPKPPGKPSLKFPGPPLFDGDPDKLDGWVTQTCRL